jgi:hypothetical protein
MSVGGKLQTCNNLKIGLLKCVFGDGFIVKNIFPCVFLTTKVSICTTLFAFRRIFMSVGAKLQTCINAENWRT